MLALGLVLGLAPWQGESTQNGTRGRFCNNLTHLFSPQGILQIDPHGKTILLGVQGRQSFRHTPKMCWNINTIIKWLFLHLISLTNKNYRLVFTWLCTGKGPPHVHAPNPSAQGSSGHIHRKYYHNCLSFTLYYLSCAHVDHRKQACCH